ncbi:MAG: 30S ribosomal protein S6 [Armatimonadota bacterium]|jgi:small subunit ribosomal protein S6|nr:30S ribosomal protein S6 [Armatimonadota bacterium]
MVRPYEALYIVNPNLSDEEVEAIIEKYKAAIEAQGAEVESASQWEKRRLAYEVKGQTEGTYVLMNFKATAEAASELDRLFRIADDVLRHIIVRTDEK